MDDGQDGAEHDLERALEALRFSWGAAYEVEAHDGGCRARRRDGRGGWIIADTASGLAGLVREDYAACPVVDGRLPDDDGAVVAMWDNVLRRRRWLEDHPDGAIEVSGSRHVALVDGYEIARSGDLGWLLDRLDFLESQLRSRDGA